MKRNLADRIFLLIAAIAIIIPFVVMSFGCTSTNITAVAYTDNSNRPAINSPLEGAGHDRSMPAIDGDAAESEPEAAKRVRQRVTEAISHATPATVAHTTQNAETNRSGQGDDVGGSKGTSGQSEGHTGTSVLGGNAERAGIAGSTIKYSVGGVWVKETGVDGTISPETVQRLRGAIDLAASLSQGQASVTKTGGSDQGDDPPTGDPPPDTR